MTNGIIIPCYNESSRLDIQSYLDYAADNKDTLICFVNDGSSDATRSTLADIKNLECDNIHIYNLSENSGKAKAVQQGALYLYNETEVETIGFIDADLSTDFNDYHRLVKTMQDDRSIRVIYGSRAKSEENNIERDGVRAIISAIVRLIILFITRLNIQDTQCGAKVFDRKLIPLVFKNDFKTRWLFDVEILLRLKKRFNLSEFKAMFLEKPLKNWVHMDGSHLGMKDAISIPLSLLRIWFVYNVIGSFKNILIEPAKVMLHAVGELSALRVSVALLAVSHTLLITFNKVVVISDPVTLAYLVLPIACLIYIIRLVTRLYTQRSRRWKWVVAYTNTFRRRFAN